jgi:co-chaperonin GroES (HSP10)
MIELSEGRILIERDEVKDLNVSGFVVPGREEKFTGTIVNVGENTGYLTGTKVMFEQYGPTELVLDDSPHVLCKAEHIIGKLKE